MLKGWAEWRGAALKRRDWKMGKELDVLSGIVCAEKLVRIESMWTFICLFQVCLIKILIFRN